MYTLPSIVQGLDITAEQNYAGASTGVGDATGLGVAYTSGAFFAKYAASKLKTSSGTTSFFTYDGAGTASTSTTYDGSEATYSALAVTYDLGVTKLYYGAETMSMNDSGDAAESKSTYGLTVPFGAVTLGWGHSNAAFTNASATITTISGDKLFAKYTLSKRTVAYITTGKSSTSGVSGALTNSSIGLFHSF